MILRENGVKQILTIIKSGLASLKLATGHSIEMSLDKKTYVLTLKLKNPDGTVLDTQTVDFPMETAFVNAEYDKTNKKIVFTLESGTTVDVPVGDLVNGLVSENDVDTELSDTSTNPIQNKVVKKALDEKANKKYYDDEYLTLGARKDGSTTGMFSSVFGTQTTASSYCSHAEGVGATATGDSSHAEGNATTASGSPSHSEGGGSIASGSCSHAEGGATKASGSNSHSEGGGTIASGNQSHSEGASTKAIGGQSHAEGASTSAMGNNSHAEGSSTTQCPNSISVDTSKSDVESAWNKTFSLAKGDSSHVEGKDSLASGDYAHAEGGCNLASGDGSHAEGQYTTALGENSHAEGLQTYAIGGNSHAEGQKTNSTGVNSHAEGQYTTALGENSHAEGESTNVLPEDITSESTDDDIIPKWQTTRFSLAKGQSSHVEGNDNLALGNSSHAEGYITKAVSKYSHAEGGGTVADGDYAHAEGSVTTASGNYSHSEGHATKAIGICSHAEGGTTKATGNYSHAEGGGITEATGDYSHAEGYITKANGFVSHAEGRNTIATGYYQHVEGKYNIEDTSNKYAHIIGNGTSDTKRSNAHTVDWNGNAWYAGGMEIEGEDGLILRDTIGNKYPPRIFTSGRSLILTSASHDIKNDDATADFNSWNRESAGLEISSCQKGIMPMYNNQGTYAGNMMINLGDSSRPFGTIYCRNTSSDKKIKKDIKNLSESVLADKYVEILDLINFVKFKWKHNMNGGMETPPSSRYHYGIIAQEIEKLLKDIGIGTYDNGIIKADFFAKNTSNAFITGGYREQFENEENGVTYDYSKNTYDFKKGNDYLVYNEILDKELSALNCCGGYNDRSNIGYIMIEDNSKLSEKYEDRPPVTIKGIILIDKEGNAKKLSIDFDKCISYYEWNDENLSNPKTSGTLNEDGSVTVSFNKKYSTYMIKVDDFNFFDYERIVLDVDYVGEYKVYLIPNATEEHVNANVYDRDRVDDIMLTYHVDYQELQILCLHALQQKSKRQASEIEELRKEIEELKGMIKNA